MRESAALFRQALQPTPDGSCRPSPVLRTVGVLLLIEQPELLIELPYQLCHPIG